MIFRPSNSISVISGRWADDNERLCSMELRLRLKRSPHQAGLEPGSLKAPRKKKAKDKIHACADKQSRPK